MSHLKKISLVGFILAPLCINAQEKTGTNDDKIVVTPQQAQQAKKDQIANVKTIASPLFDPVTADTPPKPNPFPTQSSNEAALDAIFGSGGINLSADQLRHIKICYFYMEYLAKLELAARTAALARKNNIDVVTILESLSWKGVIDKLGGWNKVVAALDGTPEPTQNDWDIVVGTIEISQWQDIVNSSFWKSITITPELLQQSPFWQNYAKYSVVKAFDQDHSLLDSIYNIETRIFMYIPNIEVAYYNQDFTHLRNSAEYLRTTMVLNDAVRNRLIKQVKDWQQYYDPKTNNLDLLKTYDAAEQFKDSDFYKLAALANQDFSSVIEQATTQKLPLQEIFGDKKPSALASEEITCLAMIKNVQAQLHFLFDIDNVEKTMSTFANKNTKKPEPNILLHEIDDYLYLEDLASVVDQFSKAAQDQKVTTQALTPVNSTRLDQANEKDEAIETQSLVSFFEKKVWPKLKDTGKKISKEAKVTWGDIKKLGGDLSKLGKDSLQAIKDEGMVAWQVGNAFGDLISGDPKQAGDLIKKAVQLQTRVATDIQQAKTDTENVINDVNKVAIDAGTMSAAAIGGVVGLVDTRLGKDVEGAFEKATAALVDYLALLEVPVFESVASLIVLSADAVAVAANLTTSVVMDIAQHKGLNQLGKDVLEGMENMVADVATTLWSSISFIGTYLISELKDAVAFVGYMVSFLTDAMVDTFAFAAQTLASLADSVGWESEGAILRAAAQNAENHRRTIAATITTVLLVGAVILTDGAALPVIAMTVGPQLFQIYGALQQDQKAIEQKKAQKQYLSDFEKFVQNNETIAQNTINTWGKELSQKYQSQVINEERQLGFYQNFLNRFFESTENQMSFYLGTNLAPQLIPNKDNLRFADVGALYGFATGDGKTSDGVLNLNPSLGFPLYNAGRKLYSQEIAVYPALSMQLDTDDKKTKSDVIYKFWFNQKETVPLENDISEVEVRFQVIYALDIFNIGLYFGGDPIDIQSIIKEKKADIDAAHLAKMLVYNKDDKDSAPVLKLYEHEGQGWFKETPQGPPFQMGTWYHMKMNLNQTTLQTKVWKENETEPNWQSFAIQKTAQKTIGMISSGASIQYEFVTPQIPISPNTQIRTSQQNSEQYREKYAQSGLQLLQFPDVEKFNLAQTSKTQILKGQYIYTTKATGLKDEKQQSIDDYVVFGKKSGDFGVDNLGAMPSITIDGQALENSPNVALTSLISGNAYKRDGSQFCTMTNALDAFLQKHGPLTDELTKTLKTEQQTQQKAQMGPFKFGTISLTTASLQDIQKGAFVYKAVSPEKELRDNGNAVKDAQGNFIYDYFLAFNSNNDVIPFSDSAKMIQSFVTGYQYNATSAKPSNPTLPYQTGSEEIEDMYFVLSGDLAKAIDNAVTFYSSKVQQETKKPSTGGTSIVSTNSGNISDPTGPHSTKPTDTSQPLDINPADNSIQKRKDDGSGNGNGDGDGELGGW